MNTREHYLMYKELVQRDTNQFFWDEQEDYLCPVRNMRGWIETTQEGAELHKRFADEVVRMSEAAVSCNEYAYRDASEAHQKAALDMMGSYVKYYIKPWRDEYGDTRGPILGLTVDEAFLAEKGMGWFKFFDRRATAKLTVGKTTVDYIVIPRYTARFCEGLEGKFYMDADEVKTAKGLSEEHFKRAQKIKERSVPYKIFIGSDGELAAKPIKSFNVPSAVRDWTLELFPL